MFLYYVTARGTPLTLQSNSLRCRVLRGVLYAQLSSPGEFLETVKQLGTPEH